MSKLSAAVLACSRKIDCIWEDSVKAGQPQENIGKAAAQTERSARQRAAEFLYARRFELLFVAVMGGVLFYLAWILPFNEAPDEKMRYLVPTYIYRHGTIPAGWDEEILDDLWGISYGFHPILPYIFGGYLMKLVGLFHSSDHALLMAARSVNVMIGMGFYWYVLQIAKRLFANRVFRLYFIALLAMLPQLLYLFVYVNTDGIAMFSSAIIIYYWLEGIRSRWDRRTCTGLAVGVSVCALSYFNAYGYALLSIVLFIGTLLADYGRRGVKYCAGVILKRGIYITVIVFLLTGWWFIRCAILYDGDFLGLYAPDRCGEIHAQEEYKPSVKKSLAEQGVSLEEMLIPEREGGMEWIVTTYRSAIGYFSYFRYPLGLDIYEIHKKLFALGILGIFLHVLLACGRWAGSRLSALTKKKGPEQIRVMFRGAEPDGGSRNPDAKACFAGYRNCPMRALPFALLQFSLICCIIIPVLLSLYYSYFSDFQPQGRYIMPMIIPVMYFTAAGTQRVLTLLFRRWMVYVIAAVLFYAVLHVFLAAFVSVYIPAFVESLKSWESIRFPWFSNIQLLNRLIQLFYPG